MVIVNNTLYLTFFFSYYENAVSVRTGRLQSLEFCRVADTTKNDPGQWKFIGIEGLLNF